MEQVERGIGQGEMPASFSRFNWGAFLLPAFWGLVYGVWPIVSIWLLALLTPVVLVAVVGLGGEAAVATNALAMSVLSEVVAGASRIYIGMRAHGMLWRRERLRLELLPESVPRYSVGKFRAQQRTWVLIGGTLMALSLLSVLVVAFDAGALGTQLREQLQVTKVEAIISVVWILAEILLGGWMAIKMRQEEAA